MTQYAWNPNLAAHDRQVFWHDPNHDWQEFHELAADDIMADLLRRGFFDPLIDPQPTLVDASEQATVTLKFTAATGEGDLTVPAGTLVYDEDPTKRNVDGANVFATDEELVVTDGSTGTVDATAVDPGRPQNVAAGELAFAETAVSGLDQFSAVTNEAAATGGVNHQLERAAVYRALALVYQDLTVEEGDPFDYKRKLMQECYDQELTRRIAAGLILDTDGDPDTVTDEESVLGYGGVKLRRS